MLPTRSSLTYQINCVGVSPSAAAAEEKRKLEYTITDLKARLHEKTQELANKTKEQGKTLIERYEEGRCVCILLLFC